MKKNNNLFKRTLSLPFYIHLIKNWIFNNKNNVSLNELFQFLHFILFQDIKEVDKKIDKVVEEDNFNKIYFIDYLDPLYFPKAYDLYFLKVIIRELCGKIDWHRYEKMGTIVSADDIVVDCGAAEGFFTYLIQKRCKHVYAVEPGEIFLGALHKTFNNSSNVTIIDKGLSDVCETLYLHDQGVSSFINHMPTDKPVYIETIDNLFFEKNIPITYLKADIEGYELKMLAGAKKTIEANHPKIAITTYHRPGDSKNIKEFLLSLKVDYMIELKGVHNNGEPIMLHATPVR